MNLFDELLNKNVKILYKEETHDAFAKIIFVKLVAATNTHIKVEFLRDKNIKIIANDLVRSMIELKIKGDTSNVF